MNAKELNTHIDNKIQSLKKRIELTELDIEVAKEIGDNADVKQQVVDRYKKEVAAWEKRRPKT
jgi:hypothetical protein